MKLKHRIITAFLIMTLLPICLSSAFIVGFGKLQMNSIEKNYGLSDATTVDTFSNSGMILWRVSEKVADEMKYMISQNNSQMEEEAFLDKLNSKIEKKGGYLIVRKEEKIVYVGREENENVEKVLQQLPVFGEAEKDSHNGRYLGGDVQVLIKQIDFTYPNEEIGSAFLVIEMGKMLPEVRSFLLDIILAVASTIMIVAFVLMYWIYSSVMHPLKEMQLAAHSIRDGNLDFELVPKTKDEIGQLTADLEDMRKRLKVNAEEKIHNDKENKELISNISHDLKTPVTAIKGYAEGILDGVADTPEKQTRYVRTIYNKATEMDRLINELTLYSKIDTNRIPYNFKILSANGFFTDCAEDLELELQAKNAEFIYTNYLEDDVNIIADSEQLERVIHNIINNSIKYMDKEHPKIQLRVKDAGDFIQIELEDNGKGIAAKDLQKIFDRFYRTDASRNSSKGGSGIGLSIVKKIVEEHGGSIWVTSKEHVGTSMCFVLRKYQEVPVNE